MEHGNIVKQSVALHHSWTIKWNMLYHNYKFSAAPKDYENCSVGFCFLNDFKAKNKNKIVSWNLQSWLAAI